ncbi:Arc family DNA-binding protein [Mesorhizobium sp. M3A.F.Ca.ET.201.01.1.1]|uniref:Arc family DNA-binding protein n=1 Tax=Mesorhizobium sp. M3A.F.Ca.ET.201.01.1.1 TaxID=2563946 RepID=UPI001FEE264D|nr:Arc family DNA-binding protein [Mesorhizobium sp. M3A.F.Ca.ET.201.01.1.1]
MVNRSNPDQFQLRLPPGLRERIKAVAEANGRSINAEIVRVLEREFPEPWTLEERVDQLHGLLGMLGQAMPKDAADDVIRHVHETLTAIATGRTSDVDEDTRGEVLRGLARWEGTALKDAEGQGVPAFFLRNRT